MKTETRIYTITANSDLLDKLEEVIKQYQILKEEEESKDDEYGENWNPDWKGNPDDENRWKGW